MIPDNEKPNIMAFNLNDDISNMLSSSGIGEDLPLYNNIMHLNDSENLNSKQRLDRLENQRQNQTLESTTSILNYKKLDANSKNKILRKFNNTNNSDIIQTRNNTDSEILNKKDELKEAGELYRLNKASKQKMIDKMTNSSISGNDVRAISPLIDNLLIEKLITLQRDMQPNYIEKVNYIIINSIDRDWFNNTESRYNFRVMFKSNSSHQGAGIQNIYKNITSVEIVNAIIPQDSILIPFDSRIYIDILSFPYLILEIPEFSDVFRGTNNNTDKAFCILIFDKQQDSTVISNDFISGNNTIIKSTPTTHFSKQFRKTFYKYTPAYFERKTFHNNPLASLGNMTLKLTTSNGYRINTLDDVLTIENITYTTNIGALNANNVDNFEYELTRGYPTDTTNNDRKYIQIKTEKNFSNKLFRLGDYIYIKGYNLTGTGTDNSRFIQFINRDEGHIILNMDIIDLTTGNNQGFTSNIYIAPPGDINNTLTRLNTTTYYDETNIDIANYTTNTSKLINGNLQTHFLFKINTREGDISQLTKPINV